MRKVRLTVTLVEKEERKKKKKSMINTVHIKFFQFLII